MTIISYGDQILNVTCVCSSDFLRTHVNLQQHTKTILTQFNGDQRKLIQRLTAKAFMTYETSLMRDNTETRISKFYSQQRRTRLWTRSLRQTILNPTTKKQNRMVTFSRDCQKARALSSGCHPRGSTKALKCAHQRRVELGALNSVLYELNDRGQVECQRKQVSYKRLRCGGPVE